MGLHPPSVWGFLPRLLGITLAESISYEVISCADSTDELTSMLTRAEMRVGLALLTTTATQAPNLNGAEAMRALVVEKYGPATRALMDGLNEATGFDVDRRDTLEEALEFMVEKHIGTVLVNVGQLGISPCHAVKSIRSRAKERLLKCPQIILLSVLPLPLDEVGGCWDLQAMCMLRQYAPPIFEAVRAGFWVRETRTRSSTIRIEHFQGHYYIDYVLGMFSEQIEVGDQPSRLAAILAGRRACWLVETLAEELDVCRQSVKKYMWELQHACLRAQRRLFIADLDKNVFWMARGIGGTRCGISARVLWE